MSISVLICCYIIFMVVNFEGMVLCVQLLKPDPMVVATKLLARRTYKDTGKQFNVIAASWIQFMIHDWIDHLEDTKQVLNLFIKLINF